MGEFTVIICALLLLAAHSSWHGIWQCQPCSRDVIERRNNHFQLHSSLSNQSLLVSQWRLGRCVCLRDAATSGGAFAEGSSGPQLPLNTKVASSTRTFSRRSQQTKQPSRRAARSQPPFYHSAFHRPSSSIFASPCARYSSPSAASHADPCCTEAADYT